ncbi:MAG TPA: hypothetical protein VMD59_24155, partial [Acidimicrobiales bacterium]|nr:hypothetical protein [Acidimicrobiales bacterium]
TATTVGASAGSDMASATGDSPSYAGIAGSTPLSATGSSSSAGSPLAYTGFGGLPIGIGGAALALVAETSRRLARRRRR